MNPSIQIHGRNYAGKDDQLDWIKEQSLADIRDLYTLIHALKAQLSQLPRQPATPIIEAQIDSLSERIGELKTFLEIEVDGVVF
tara:strand:+ start:382 stop:633 length:252 start_codon:yes stop_codon:yes gene_type:complete